MLSISDFRAHINRITYSWGRLGARGSPVDVTGLKGVFPILQPFLGVVLRAVGTRTTNRDGC